MASDTELFKDKIEISLDGRQVFYLFFGGAVIASLVFVLGVMVGKRVESRSHLERSAATSAALDPLAALDQLSGGGAPAMSYASTLAGGAAAPSAVDRTIADMEKNRAAAPAPVKPAPAPAAAPPVDQDDERDAAAEKAAAEKAAEKAAKDKAAAEKAAAEKAAKDKAAAEKAAADKDAKAKFTLQLSSFQDRGEAEVFLSRMKTSGYGAAVMTEAVVEGKGTYFRIRFGRYATYEDAVAAKGKFEADQQIIAYVTRL